MLTATVLSWLLFFVTAHAYETWHLVDLSQVICPKPTSSMTDAPEFPEYNLGINYTNELQVDAPHIVGFIRASKQAVSITFKIEDFYGEQVVPETTVELQEGSDAIPSACSCTNPNVPPEVSATYGVGYGSSCGQWDEARCGTLWGNITVGDWCCRSWCYATADCPDAYQSQAIPGQFFSYAACSVTHPPPSTCSWSEVQKKRDFCNCKDQSSLFNAAMQAKVVDSYGSSCSAWDMVNCAANYRPDQVDTWCCANWCYVDKECPSAVASLNPGMEGILYWSDTVCVDDPALMMQCPYKPQPNVSANDTSCDCLGATIPIHIYESWEGNPTYFADYGSQCGPHDADICDITYPGADHAIWCCTSWCWVSENCPTARGSTLWPGHFWSTEHCELDAEAVSSCKWESLCECRGQLPAGTFDGNGNFAADYGSSCSAWDSVNCKVVWGSDADSSWNTSSDHEWCCDSWCYVNEACPIAKKSWLGIGFYFSYETCDDPATTYNEQTDSCDPLRRLSARRRFGGGGGWSFGGSRRRSPWAASTSARRRSWSAPSTVSQRRRAPPPPAVRRRVPPPVPSPMAGRRRSSSLSGQSFSTTPRRRATSSVEASLRRRRTIPETTYGYANRPHMMNNYGGTMPYQTPYGYTGYNAIPQQSSPNVAMYGAAGFAGGLGAAYMYNNMYSDSWGMHRRRRYGDFHNQNFCIVTDPGSRNGAFMACEQCYHLYGFSSCPSADSCRTATGCRYTTPQSYSRDELAATGFIPQAYTPPLKVIFTSITGQGIDTTSICPPLTFADVALDERFNRTMSFKPELFLVLSRQDVVEAVEQTGAGAATGFAPLAVLLLMLVLPHLHK